MKILVVGAHLDDIELVDGRKLFRFGRFLEYVVE